MIVVNARFLTQNVSSMQRFAFEVARRLKKLNSNYIFVSPPNIMQKDWAAELEAKVIGENTGSQWEQITLNSFLRQNGWPFLLNLAGMGPFNYRNQFITVHDTAFFNYQSSEKLSVKLWGQYLSQSLNNNVKGILVISQSCKDELQKTIPAAVNKTYVVYSGYPQLNNFDSTLEQDLAGKSYFLAINSIDPRKNIERIMAAFNLAALPGFKLKIAGHTTNIFDENEAKDHNIEFLGQCNDNQMASLYKHAAALVFPSLHEGFGLPMLEAMSLGCPVIASNIAVLKEVGGDGALYVNPLDVKAISGALKQIVSDTPLADSLKAKGLQLVQGYSWDNTTQKINQLVTEAQLDG
ncbi:MAG: glycosyltransferase family 4 protein [Spirochaetaceae bacterium]|nr:glycosyltransferase family 4 protein [Spirochaetaceae bacterium]